MYCNAFKAAAAVYKHEICGQTFSRPADQRHANCNRKLPIMCILMSAFMTDNVNYVITNRH